MNATEPADSLIGAIKHRNREALNRFLITHRDQLGQWVRFRLGVPAGRGADHSDALQDVSIKVWQCIDTFEGTTEAQLLQWFQQRLRWWVVGLSRKRVLGATRGAELPAGAADESGLLERLPAEIGSPSQLAVQAEREERIRVAGGELTNEQMAVLLLHDVDGIPLKEIARQFAATPVEIARHYLSATTAIGPTDEEHRAEMPHAADWPAAALFRAMRQLPPIERQAILLKHLERFTMEEAAETLQTSPAAIGSAVYRGMKQLRGLLDPPQPPADRIDVQQN